jgi:hypothetical protein
MISSSTLERVLPLGPPLFRNLLIDKLAQGVLPRLASPASCSEGIAVFNSEDCAGRQPNATRWSTGPRVECADELDMAMTSSRIRG